MADREKVVKGLEAMREFFGFGLPSQQPVFEAYQNILTDALELLKEQEAVVRCRDCKHARRMCQPWNDLVCEKNGQTNRPDFYCADGERK